MEQENKINQIVAGALFVIVFVLLWTSTAGATVTCVTSMIQFPRSDRLSHPFLHPRRDSIHVSLERIDADGNRGGPIENKPTWVVIHGRTSDSSSFYSLASAIAMRESGSQVLLLDWSEGASDNMPTGLMGAAWIPSVAQWAGDALKSIGLNGRDVSLVGHSWGAHIAYDIAAGWNDGPHHGVRSLVALDPASAGVGLTPWSIDLSAVADRSWAFYDSDACGCASIALTATEAFQIDCGSDATVIEQHWACVPFFEQLIRRDDQAAQLFSLDRLQSAVAGIWDAAIHAALGTIPASEFTVVLHLDRSVDGMWDDLRSLTYRSHGQHVQLALNQPFSSHYPHAK